MIHRLTYQRTNHGQIHVHGFQEQGTTTTPFDMAVMNKIDRFHLAIAALDCLPGLSVRATQAKQQFRHKLIEHDRFVREHGEDMPEILEWVWPHGRESDQT